MNIFKTKIIHFIYYCFHQAFSVWSVDASWQFLVTCSACDSHVFMWHLLARCSITAFQMILTACQATQQWSTRPLQLQSTIVPIQSMSCLQNSCQASLKQVSNVCQTILPRDCQEALCKHKALGGYLFYLPSLPIVCWSEYLLKIDIGDLYVNE